jgi:hypothetical protein
MSRHCYELLNGSILIANFAKISKDAFSVSRTLFRNV